MTDPDWPERGRRRRRPESSQAPATAARQAVSRALAGTAPPWVHRLSAGAAEGALAPPPGFVAWRLDGRRATTKARLLAEIARVLDFPPHFGGTWDALEDCLTDLSWRPAAGYRLVIETADGLLVREPAAASVLLAVLESVGRAWATRATGHPDRPAVPFHTVLVGDRSAGMDAGSGAAPPSA